ncbi:MAG: hypothetical protein QNJ19_15170 [Woeseiaceae bacterium]|nr:hypothetical protein [Woeseiaceae bacterium]
MKTKPYHELSGFEDIYLEDSFVLNIRQIRNTVEIFLDFVLRETHRSFRPPPPGEKYCYRRGRLVFRNVVCANWEKLSFIGATDATEEADFGNVDEFEFEDGNFYLTGEWGQLSVSSSAPEIKFDQ